MALSLKAGVVRSQGVFYGFVRKADSLLHWRDMRGTSCRVPYRELGLGEAQKRWDCVANRSYFEP